MDVVSDQHRHPCWICGGSGRASLLAGSSEWICAMCGGFGLVTSVPSTESEMVDALVAVSDFLRHQLTAKDQVQIDEIEQIVRQCLAEIEAEDGP